MKPRGGQWWSDRDINLGGYTENNSPENAVRALAARYFDTPEDEIARALFPEGDDLNRWLQRALPRYIKNDLGTPDDPLRYLAAQGLLHVPEITSPQEWTDLASQAIMQDPLEQIMFPRNPKGGMRGAGNDLRGGVLSTMPWLAKAPVTDALYGMTPYGLNRLGFGDVVLGMQKAMLPAIYDIPPEFVVRPESLGRMSFPQAVEHVGKIEQALAAKRNEAAQAALAGPALSTFKEYPDDPKGLRWVEFKHPEEAVPIQGWELKPGRTDGWKELRITSPYGKVVETFDAETPEEVALAEQKFNDFLREQALKDALECESDQLGICVGRWRDYPQYYQGIMSGDKRIFSLRDAKGESHATIETQPSVFPMPYEVHQEISRQALEEANASNFETWVEHENFQAQRQRELKDQWRKQQKLQNPTDRIVQIKGTANERPADPYQPYITDFIKSGKWSNIGDMGHTDVVKLPDGRYITKSQYAEGLAKAKEAIGQPNVSDLGFVDLIGWDRIAPHFQGYAYGGRVSARDCFCHNPLSVR